ncbi:MAG: ABC transporter ATP-binding protein [Oscillibacter sp.]|nr:ABC transporter ATP-binding protein [Oscillibacter sp.]
MIQVENVVKLFDGFRALDGASLTVPTGSVYGLVGPNGAGKSTIIRHLTGIYRQDSGTVQMNGENVWENPALKEKIAAIPDDWFYFNPSTVRDMMRFYRGFYPKFSMERYEKLKEVFQIDEKRVIRRLSKGMQKQVAFWLTLCCMPDFLILDEPVDGLDPVMRRQVWSLVMGDVTQNGTTVLVSSHNLRELEDVCDHVGIMDHGKVLLERSLEQLQDNMVKLQVVFPEGVTEVPPELPILHASKTGRVHTLIMRMNAEDAENAVAAYHPMLAEAVPLTLEEIFIYELGGVDYEVKDILL